MRFIMWATCFLFLLTGKVSGHEHWVDADNFYPAVGEKGKIFICSGHSFPKSNTALKDRVLHNTEIIKSDGKAVSYQTIEDGKRRSADFRFDSSGTHVVGFTLKQPQMKQPMYWARSIILVGGHDDEKLYSIGKGMEIVPAGKLSALRKGDRLSLIVLYNGVQVDAHLSILPEKARSLSLSTTSERPASLSISEEGRYLVTTSYNGKSCSLTFFIQKAATEK